MNKTIVELEILYSDAKKDPLLKKRGCLKRVQQVVTTNVKALMVEIPTHTNRLKTHTKHFRLLYELHIKTINIAHKFNIVCNIFIC
jgi:hypothetical protein